MAKRKIPKRRQGKTLSFSEWIKHGSRHKTAGLLFVLLFGVAGYMMLQFSSAQQDAQSVTLTINGVTRTRTWGAPTPSMPEILVQKGAKLTVKWSSTGSQECSSNYWTTNKATSGSVTINAGSYTQIYAVSCLKVVNATTSRYLPADIRVRIINEAQIPTRIQNLRAGSITTSSLKLYWDRAVLLGGPGSVRHKVYRYSAGAYQAVNDVGSNTSFSVSGLSPGTTYTFNVCAYNTERAANEACLLSTDVLKVTTAATASTPAPTPSPPASVSPTPLPRTSTPTRRQTQPAIQGSGTTPGSFEAAVEPPTEPQEFAAKFEEDGGTVRLTWLPPDNDYTDVHYELRRSADNETWSTLADDIYETEYHDTDASFETQYFYKLRAVNTAGTSQDVETNIKTGGFRANVTVEHGGEVAFSDGQIVVRFPSDAVSEDMQCSVTESRGLPNIPVPYHILSGPYEVTCKTATSQVVRTFGKTLQVIMQFDGYKGYTDTHVRAMDTSQEWIKVDSSLEDKTLGFDLEDSASFLVAGKPKSTPLIVKLLLGLLAIVAVCGAIVGLLYVRYRRQQLDVYSSYVRQSRGY